MNIIVKSKKHCNQVNENYLKHMNVAVKISFSLFIASIMALIHAFIPALFEKSASNKIIKMYNYLQEKKRIEDEN